MTDGKLQSFLNTHTHTHEEYLQLIKQRSTSVKDNLVFTATNTTFLIADIHVVHRNSGTSKQ